MIAAALPLLVKKCGDCVGVARGAASQEHIHVHCIVIGHTTAVCCCSCRHCCCLWWRLACFASGDGLVCIGNIAAWFWYGSMVGNFVGAEEEALN